MFIQWFLHLQDTNNIKTSIKIGNFLVVPQSSVANFMTQHIINK